MSSSLSMTLKLISCEYCTLSKDLNRHLLTSIGEYHRCLGKMIRQGVHRQYIGRDLVEDF